MDRQFFVVGCGTVTTALGRIECGKFKGLPKGFIFTTDDFHVDMNVMTSPEDVVEFLDANALSIGGNLPPVIAYYPNLVNIEPSGGEPNIVTEGFGGGIPNGLTPKSEVYTITDGGLCMYDQLAKLKNRLMRVILIDENDIAYGTIDSHGRFRGFQAYVVPYLRDNTGAQTGAILLMLQYQKGYENELDNQAQVALDDEVMTLREIVMANFVWNLLTPFGATFRATTNCGGRSVTHGNTALTTALVTRLTALATVNVNGNPVPAAAVTFAHDPTTDTITMAVTGITPTAGQAVELRINGELLNDGTAATGVFNPFIMQNTVMRITIPTP